MLKPHTTKCIHLILVVAGVVVVSWRCLSSVSALSMIAKSDLQVSNQPSPHEEDITILGFGSLLSLQSARLTFPTLTNFRLGRIPNHRRVFAHPASIFFLTYDFVNHCH